MQNEKVSREGAQGPAGGGIWLRRPCPRQSMSLPPDPPYHSLPPGGKPFSSLVQAHSSPHPPCPQALHRAGLLLAEPALILEAQPLVGQLSRPGRLAATIGRDARLSARGPTHAGWDLQGWFAALLRDAPALTAWGPRLPALMRPTSHHHVSGTCRWTLASPPGTPAPCLGPRAPR